MIQYKKNGAIVLSQQILQKFQKLARDRFASRADHYDRTASFPLEDFEDLQRANLLAPLVPERLGGLDLNFKQNAHTLWRITEELASVNMSLARCWEGHANSQVLIAGMANLEQQERWFEGIVKRGEKWAAWSGEPQIRIPDQKESIGTEIRETSEGYVINGSKVFASSAGAANWALLLVNPAGSGGARHTSSPDTVLLFACDLSSPGIRFDDSWWDPIGMRATVSYRVLFDEVCIPHENIIGQPGQYIREAWQAKFVPQYASALLGGARGAYEYALECANHPKKAEDPYVRHHIAHMRINIDTAQLWLQHVARLWQEDDSEKAQFAGSCARYTIEQLAEDTIRRCIRIGGARCLNGPGPVGRIYRDLAIYARHDNDDQILASVGKKLLGQTSDLSFFTPHPTTEESK